MLQNNKLSHARFSIEFMKKKLDYQVHFYLETLRSHINICLWIKVSTVDAAEQHVKNR